MLLAFFTESFSFFFLCRQVHGSASTCQCKINLESLLFFVLFTLLIVLLYRLDKKKVMSFSSLPPQDGDELPPPITFDVSTAVIPPSQGSYFVNNEVQDLVVKFLKEYYTIYDSDNRQPLIDAYHENALFSLSTAPNPITEYKQPFLGDYFSASRNDLRIKGRDDREKGMWEKEKRYFSLLSLSLSHSLSLCLSFSLSLSVFLSLSRSEIFDRPLSWQSHQSSFCGETFCMLYSLQFFCFESENAY